MKVAALIVGGSVAFTAAVAGLACAFQAALPGWVGVGSFFAVMALVLFAVIAWAER